MSEHHERPAVPGELCTCGRQARVVYLVVDEGGFVGPVGSCGIGDGGRGGPRPCPFCHGAIAHGFERCPRYTLRPATCELEHRPVGSPKGGAA
jgi:hypothetical protein